MTSSPVIEAGDSGRGLWLQQRRLRLALFIGLVESILVVAGGLGWFWVLALAAVPSGAMAQSMPSLRRHCRVTRMPP